MNSPQKPFGKYFLLEKMATGGMAEIYKAKTFGVDGFEKIVVIKKILPHWAADPEFITMLVDEAKLAVQLNHNNIVSVLDLGSVDNDYYIALEYIEGCDLKTLMQRIAEKGKKISPDVACFIAMQTAAGLAYAHHKTDSEGNNLGVIHRDVTPHNILLSYNGDVKVGDFGIAKATSKKSFTATGMLRGKFSYMSPEQVRSETLTPQSDIFSLGVILFEMLSGKKCFDADTEIGILDKIRNAPVQLENLPEEIPEVLKKILLKALAHDLNDRYTNAEEMQRDLAQALAQIHAGFLPKDFASFLASYKQKSNQELSAPKPDHTLSRTAQTAISYIPGTSPKPPAPKKSSNTALIFILLFLFLFFVGFVGGGYLAWIYWLGPKLAQNKIPNLAPPPTSVPIIPTAPVIPVPVNPTESKPLAETAPAMPTTPLVESKPETIPESAPKPQWGSAAISSNPQGADIFLNGRPTGLKTPAALNNLELHQTHQIRLMKNGYMIVETTYTPQTADTQAIEIPLRELPQNAVNTAPRAPRVRSAPQGQPLRQVAPQQTSPNLMRVGN